MQRRKFVLGLGSLTAGGAAAVGSGAFTTAEATRDVAVEVADDSTGYVALQSSGGKNGQFASQRTNGRIGLDFSGSDGGGTGVGRNSVYNFDDVFRVTNQGTQTVYVWSRLSGGSKFDDNNLYFYPNGSRSTELNDNSNSVLALSPGETANIGVHIDTESFSLGSDSLTATIRADVDKPGSSESVGPEGDEALVVSQTPDQGDFSSIQSAIDSADGTTILVQPGTYNEMVTVDKSVTIRAANGQPTVESPDGNGSTFEVTADGVTIEGFEIKNSVGKGGSFAYNQGVSATGPISDLTIRNNEFRDLGSGTGAKGNSAPIVIQTKSDVLVENVDIVNNELENVVGRLNPDSNFPNRYPKGIYITSKPGGSPAGTIRDVTIRGNEIHNIEGPQSAHGIQLHDQVEDVEIKDNQIYEIRGDPNDSNDFGYAGDDWASAIQLSQTGGTVQDVIIENNYLRADSSPTDVSQVSSYAEDDRATPGFALEVAGAADPTTIELRDNALAADGGIINKTGGGVVDARLNWWGDASGPSSPSTVPNGPYSSGGSVSLKADGSGALVVDFNEDGVAEINFNNYRSSSPVSSPSN